jgi:hypothetical protein
MTCPSDAACLPSQTSRTQGRPGAGRTHGPRATKKHAAEPQVTAATTGLPCAMVYLAYTRSPRGPAFLPPSLARSSKHRKLGISTGMPGPHDFAVRDVAFVRELIAHCTTSRPPHLRPNTRDDRKAPLLVGQDGRKCASDLHDGASDFLFTEFISPPRPRKLTETVVVCLLKERA